MCGCMYVIVRNINTKYGQISLIVFFIFKIIHIPYFYNKNNK